AESSDHYQKQNLSAQTDDAAARIRHDQRHSHEHGGKGVERSLVRFDRTRKQESQRQRQRQFHVTRKMVTIDERTESGALRQLAKPINFCAVARERLRQSEHRQKESEDNDRSRQRPQASRGIDEDQSRREIDEERRDLYQDQPRRVGIEREAA